MLTTEEIDAVNQAVRTADLEFLVKITRSRGRLITLGIAPDLAALIVDEIVSAANLRAVSIIGEMTVLRQIGKVPLLSNQMTDLSPAGRVPPMHPGAPEGSRG